MIVLLRTILRFFYVLFLIVSTSYVYADSCIDSDGNVITTDMSCRSLFVSEFAVETTQLAANTTFGFYINAAGNFTIDWGDGSDLQQIQKTSTGNKYFSHTYTDSKVYKISLSGQATGYSQYAAINFSSNKNISKFYGSLGAVFGVTSSGGNPYFDGAFMSCSNLTEIPATLFSGISGSNAGMFRKAFMNCSSLKSIPAGLFDNIQGSDTTSMFSETFSGCSALQELPENLFSGYLNPSSSMFYATFKNCSSLKVIPSGLFSGVHGTANYLFNSTFNGCSSLQQVASDIFVNVTPGGSYLFACLFCYCTNLQTVPQDLFARISYTSVGVFQQMFYNCRQMEQLPENLFKHITGSPSNRSFYQTFYNCTGLSGYVPNNMFAGLNKKTGGMQEIFYNTGLDTKCPIGTYQYKTGFEAEWSGRVSCQPCPDGMTSAAGGTSTSDCFVTKKLHFGDDFLYLSPKKITSPAVVFDIDGKYLYLCISEDEKNMNYNTNKKLRLFINNKDYWVYDFTNE